MTDQAAPLLRIEGVKRTFSTPAGELRALDGVDLSIARGEAVALVGESGSGKSTLARIAVGLDRPTAGFVRFGDIDVTGARRKERRRLNRKISLVFQDPYNSLNPKIAIWRSVEEPLKIHGCGSAKARRRKADELLDLAGLDPALGDRKPRALSGGQRQRVAIARAVALDPELVILDEPVSALDVSVQAQVLNLLAELRRNMGLAYLFISHDLAVVRHIADEVAVMYLGRLVEVGASDSLFREPRHPYTAALCSNAMEVGREQSGKIALPGDPPSPLNLPTGCRFRPRCLRAQPRCAAEDPALADRAGRQVACHFPGPPTAAELRSSSRDGFALGDSPSNRTVTSNRSERKS